MGLKALSELCEMNVSDTGQANHPRFIAQKDPIREHLAH
jgi:hypothetical protein